MPFPYLHRRQSGEDIHVFSEGLRSSYVKDLRSRLYHQLVTGTSFAKFLLLLLYQFTSHSGFHQVYMIVHNFGLTGLNRYFSHRRRS